MEAAPVNGDHRCLLFQDLKNKIPYKLMAKHAVNTTELLKLGIFMTDPRNVAHDKKVQQEKKNHGEEISPNAEHAPQPGQKPALKQDDEHQEEDA